MTTSEHRTRRDLDRALRQLLEQKPLEQLRVRELTELCAIRRQSFYYHFPDIYALFDWSLQQEEATLRARQEACLTWQQYLAGLLEHTAGNRRYYQTLLTSRGRDGLRQVMGLETLVERTVTYYQRRCGGSREDADTQNLLQGWDALLMALVESWVREAPSPSPEALVELLEQFFQQRSLGAAWQNLPLCAALN